jgi:hypothetical protein
MSELFPNDDTSWNAEYPSLYPGEVPVYYKDGETFVILETVQAEPTSRATESGREQYDRLHLGNGEALVPFYLSSDEKVVAFAQKVEPLVRLDRSALLRTKAYSVAASEDKAFIDAISPHIVRDMVGDMTDIEDIRGVAFKAELERIPALRQQLRELVHFYDFTMGEKIWIRLEPTYEPDKALVGKIIMAPLRDFAANEVMYAISPIISSTEDNKPMPIPEQLGIHDTWLYVTDNHEEPDEI